MLFWRGDMYALFGLGDMYTLLAWRYVCSFWLGGIYAKK